MTDDAGALALAERVLAILDEGSFSATYKFALFTAILDLCLEGTTSEGEPPTTITTRQLASRVLELYWPHAQPYEARGTLRQGGVRSHHQAEVVRRIADFRLNCAASNTDTPYRARQAHRSEFRRLLDFVEWKLIEMPIPRLQVLGREEDRFLYEYNWSQGVRYGAVAAYQRGELAVFDNLLRLKPGVAAHVVRLNSVLRPLFRREWTLMVAAMNHLPQSELERFLFGAERVPLDAVRRLLLDLQEGRCFYCGGSITARADVDHFLPWSRYADDGLDNLVVTHQGCNNSKRDFMAATDHVVRWRSRTSSRSSDLLAIATSLNWRRDELRTVSVARTLYLRLPITAQLWESPNHFVPPERERLAAALLEPPPSVHPGPDG